MVMKIVTICGEAKKIRKRRMESNDQIMKIEELKQLKGGTSLHPNSIHLTPVRGGFDVSSWSFA